MPRRLGVGHRRDRALPDTVAGAIARFLIPNDALERMGGLVSWLLTLILGLVGAGVSGPR